MKIRVLHSYYGCESGCCGHVVELNDEELRGSFDFMHCEDKEEAKEFAKSFLEKHNPECLASIDWDTFEFLEGGC